MIFDDIISRSKGQSIREEEIVSEKESVRHIDEMADKYRKIMGDWKTFIKEGYGDYLDDSSAKYWTYNLPSSYGDNM